MNPKVKFALTLVVLFVLILGAIAGGFLVAWPTLSDPEKTLIAGIYAERVGLFVLFGVFLLAALGALLFYLFKLYVFPPKALAEEIKLILTVNPDYRIIPKGANELKELAIAANRFADSYRTQASDIESRITAAKSDLELEKSRLATLVSELTEGVVVCNTEGQVLLYNSHARQLLQPDDKTESASGGILGLGRSLYGVLDKNVINHALDYIRARPGEDHPLTKFVAATPSGEMIKATMAAVSGSQGDITGFVLTMEDVAQAREAASGRDALLRSLTDGMREALGTIRAATETLLDIADMDPKSRARFIKIIRDKTIESNARLDHTVREFSKYLQAQFLMQEMLGADLALATQAKLAATVEVDCTVECPDSAIWLNVESYSLVQAITYIAGKLHNDCGVRKVALKLERVGRFAYLDLVWSGTKVSTEQLRSWQVQPLIVKGEGIPMTLKEVAEQHRAEILYQADKSLNMTYLRWILPVAEPAAQPRSGVSRAASLGYYDFDLFHQPGQTTELDESRLSDLAYTVFDTETTGLNPSQGDEIISIGAVRVVNGRLLRAEVLDQLIDPRRALSDESIRIHGISPEMLEGKPTIERVLPAFYRFSEHTVLVAHNAAFDMRFLQMKENETGIKFIHPVLDTLLLSQVVHPNQDAHALEEMATRLGIQVSGRHTALADAMVTAEIFLKLIKLLGDQGIHTLKDAREAEQKTAYARITY